MIIVTTPSEKAVTEAASTLSVSVDVNVFAAVNALDSITLPSVSSPALVIAIVPPVVFVVPISMFSVAAFDPVATAVVATTKNFVSFLRTPA